MLIDAAQRYALDDVPPEQGARWCALRFGQQPPPDDQLSTQHTPVYANEGRWVVDCPCGSAQLACRTDHRFYCHECCNAAVFGKWVLVVWPDTIADIEGLLEQRMYVKNRNWLPSESLMDLAAENASHGVGF